MAKKSVHRNETFSSISQVTSLKSESIKKIGSSFKTN